MGGWRERRKDRQPLRGELRFFEEIISVRDPNVVSTHKPSGLSSDWFDDIKVFKNIGITELSDGCGNKPAV